MDFRTLNLLFRFSKEFSHSRIRMKGLSDTEYMICSFAYTNEGCSQDDVVSALKIDKTTVGKALFTLEKKGCVERTTDTKDKRKKCLRVTEEGYKRIMDLMNVHNDWLSEVMTCLSSEEQEQFEGYCKRLLAKAESLADENTI